MRLIQSVFLFSCLSFVAYGIYLNLWQPFTLEKVENTNRPFYDYTGIVNVSSIESSGSGTIEDIMAAANNSDLDFIILTDLNDFVSPEEKESYYNKVLLLSGGKYSYSGSRMLNMFAETNDHLQGLGRLQSSFADLLSEKRRNRKEGLFILAHPLKPGYQLARIPTGIDGIELFNLKSIWQWTWMNSKFSLFWSVIFYPFNKELSFTRMLLDSAEEEFRLWDNLNKSGQYYGYVGTDAEAKVKIYRDLFLTFPAYQTLFSIMRNHVLLTSELTGNVAQDKLKIKSALEAGHFYIATDMLSSAKGFQNYIQKNDIPIGLPGDNVKLTKGIQMVVELPGKPSSPFEVLIYKGNDKFMSSNSIKTVVNLHAEGVYRVEVQTKISMPLPEGNRWIRWIVSNPFFVN